MLHGYYDAVRPTQEQNNIFCWMMSDLILEFSVQFILSLLYPICFHIIFLKQNTVPVTIKFVYELEAQKFTPVVHPLKQRAW